MAKHVDHIEPGTFECGTQLVDSIQALPSLVLSSTAAAADMESLRHSSGPDSQRAINRDDGSIPFLTICGAKSVDHQAAIDDFQRKASAGCQNAGGLPQHGVMLFVGVEEPEGIHDDGSVGTFRLNR